MRTTLNDIIYQRFGRRGDYLQDLEMNLEMKQKIYASIRKFFNFECLQSKMKEANKISAHILFVFLIYLDCLSLKRNSDRSNHQ